MEEWSSSAKRTGVFRADLNPWEAGRRYDFETYLPDENLVKVDRAAMAHGIEARVPLIDRKLVEFAFSLDPHLVNKGGERKYLLKRAASKWLPSSILTPRKKGFSPPLHIWLADGALQTRFRDEIASGYLVANGFLRLQGLKDVDAERLLSLFLYEKWAQKWL